MKRVVRLADPPIGCGRSHIDFGRAFHIERLMRTFVVELFQEGIELGLLLQQIGASGPGGFLLESQVHAFMPAVLLWISGLNAFDADA
jgi:hypothetical protein